MIDTRTEEAPMRYEILHQPSYAVARVVLAPNESIRAESGAMVSMSPNVEIEAKMQGGFLKSLSRSILGRESFFQTTLTSIGAPGEVLLAPATPGDIAGIQMNGIPYLVTSGCFLAAEQSLDMDTQWGGMRTFFAAEGLFMLRLMGVGLLLVSSFGGVHRITLEPGQQYVIDNGHLVAFAETTDYRVEKAARGLISTFTSGEGLVTRFVGPGDVYLQTRSIDSFMSWLRPYLPSKND
jgi:uncharacterized protein (TIGR00266 family)